MCLLTFVITDGNVTVGRPVFVVFSTEFTEEQVHTGRKTIQSGKKQEVNGKVRDVLLSSTSYPFSRCRKADDYPRTPSQFPSETGCPLRKEAGKI